MHIDDGQYRRTLEISASKHYACLMGKERRWRAGGVPAVSAVDVNSDYRDFCFNPGTLFIC